MSTSDRLEQAALDPRAWLDERERIASAAWHKGEWRTHGEVNFLDVWAEVPDSARERVATSVWASDGAAIADARNHAGEAYAALRAVLDLCDSTPEPYMPVRQADIRDAIAAALGEA